MRDMKNDVDSVISLTPAARTNGTVNGTGVDLANYDGAIVEVFAGVLTDGTQTVTVEESDDNSTYTAVAAADLIGTLAAFVTTDDGVIRRVGYIGRKRYIRTVDVTSGATTGGLIGANVIRGYPKKGPRA
jgi:hypothetical protein